MNRLARGFNTESSNDVLFCRNLLQDSLDCTFLAWYSELFRASYYFIVPREKSSRGGLWTNYFGLNLNKGLIVCFLIKAEVQLISVMFVGELLFDKHFF
jgi:hypothetical protein